MGAKFGLIAANFSPIASSPSLALMYLTSEIDQFDIVSDILAPFETPLPHWRFCQSSEAQVCITQQHNVTSDIHFLQPRKFELPTDAREEVILEPQKLSKSS